MSFNDAAVLTVFDKVVSYALASGRFETVNGHEPKSSPGNGLTCAVWVQRIRPLRSSGLAFTSGVLDLQARIYTSFIAQPSDMIDPNVSAATSDIIGALSGDFDLGGDADVRCVDLLGMSGDQLGAQAGYLEIDRKMYRVMTINIPVIINDMWLQAGSETIDDGGVSTLTIQNLEVLDSAIIDGDLSVLGNASVGGTLDVTGGISARSLEWSNVFGDGSDGDVILDGVNTVTWASKAGSVYTVTRAPHLTSLLINNGVTLKASGYQIFCRGTVTNNGIITADGNAGAANGTAGTNPGNGTNPGGRPGAAGSTTTGANASSTGFAGGGAGANGGSGASGSGGTGASANGPPSQWWRIPYPILAGVMSSFASSVQPCGGMGGGGGGGDGAVSGGGGGSGGGTIWILAWSVVNNGTFTAKGGDGGSPASGNAGGGGGGGGGTILVYTLVAWTSGTTSVTGGTGGTKTGTGTNGSNGASGTLQNVVMM